MNTALYLPPPRLGTLVPYISWLLAPVNCPIMLHVDQFCFRIAHSCFVPHSFSYLEHYLEYYLGYYLEYYLEQLYTSNVTWCPECLHYRYRRCGWGGQANFLTADAAVVFHLYPVAERGRARRQMAPPCGDLVGLRRGTYSNLHRRFSE